jgi:hypothetical protein
MAALVDNVIALRLLYIFITPFNQTDAFKFGIIDATGKPLKKVSQLKTQKEQDSYSMLHRLAFRLKRVLATIPFGSTNFASYAAAYALVKENLNSSIESQDLEELFISMLNEIEDDTLILSEDFTNDINLVLLENSEIRTKLQLEDAPTNSTAGVGDLTVPSVPQKKRKKLKYMRVSKSIFNVLPKTENTLYKVNEDLIYFDAL